LTIASKTYCFYISVSVTIAPVALFSTVITVFVLVFYFCKIYQPCYFCSKPNETCFEDGFAVSSQGVSVLQLKSEQFSKNRPKPKPVSKFRVGF